LVVLQKMSRDIKGLTQTPTYTAMLKRLDTNPTCPRISPLPSSPSDNGIGLVYKH
jgi:hypothetical protein